MLRIADLVPSFFNDFETALNEVAVNDTRDVYIRRFYLDALDLAQQPDAAVKFVQNEAIADKMEEQVVYCFLDIQSTHTNWFLLRLKGKLLWPCPSRRCDSLR